MDITKIAVLGLCAAVFAVLLKESHPVFALCVSSIAALVIFLKILPSFYYVTEFIADIQDYTAIKTQHISVLIKSIVISYVAMFTSQICRDFNQNAIGDKIELGGKILIMTMAVPVIKELIDTVLGVL